MPNEPTNLVRPLDGIKIIDFTHVFAGPFSAYQLAVMGADVIKVEPIDNPDMMRPVGKCEELAAKGMSENFQAQNSEKRAIALNLKSAEGQAVAKRLIMGADVVVENYRRGVMAGFGLDANSLRAEKPELIYASLTGFGQTGPLGGRPAYDNVIQAYSGLMAATGTLETHPVRVGPAVLDYGTGTHAALAILGALYQRKETGEGNTIDISMTDAALMLMSSHVMMSQVTGETPPPAGNEPYDFPGYGVYHAADAGVMVGAFTPKQQRDFHALADAPDDKVAVENVGKENALDWEERLANGGVPAARIRRIDECINSEQIASRQVLQENPLTEAHDHGCTRVPVAAYSYERGSPRVTKPAPYHGEHNAEVLAEFGYSEGEISGLVERGVLSGS